MPKRNSINLKDLCFHVICREVEILKDHLTCPSYALTTNSYERKKYFGLDVKKWPFEIVINEFTTKLEFQDILHLPDHKLTDKECNSSDKRIDKCIQRVFERCLVKNVRYINLSECKSVKPSLQLKLIQHFNQIEIFKIFEFGNDELLAAIGTYCPQLTHLNVSCSEKVTDKGIESLCNNKEMKIVDLDIYETKVTAKGCLCALKTLKCLKVFSHSCWNELFEMLELEMHSTPAYLAYPAMKEIIDCDLNEEQLNVAGVAFPNLRTLEIGEINFNHIDVRNLEKVTDLTVHSVNIDINIVGLCWPHLKALHLDVSNFTNSQNSQNSQTPFKQLRRLELFCSRNQIPEEDLSLLLNNCRYLNKLELKFCQTLTDVFFKSLIKINPLYYLTHLEIFCCDHVSVTSLMTMFQMNNFLNQVIICRCSLLNAPQLNELQTYVKKNNLNVNITFVV